MCNPVATELQGKLPRFLRQRQGDGMVCVVDHDSTTKNGRSKREQCGEEFTDEAPQKCYVFWQIPALARLHSSSWDFVENKCWLRKQATN